MLRMRLACGIVVLSALACGEDSPTGPGADLLVGRWLAYETEYGGVVRNLTGPGPSGIGQFEFSSDGTAQIRFWFDGHLAPVTWPFEWKTDGDELLIRNDPDRSWDSLGTYSVNRATLVLTFVHNPDSGSTVEVWRYSRVKA